jgi:hypothetical protein
MNHGRAYLVNTQVLKKTETIARDDNNAIKQKGGKKDCTCTEFVSRVYWSMFKTISNRLQQEACALEIR